MTWQEFQKKYADNNRNRRGAPLVRPDESLLAGMSLHEIEVEFRKQMRTNHANLKRMFIAMDKHLDGFISLEDLKSVLFQFTLPMSEQLFTALMDRWLTVTMFYLVNLTFKWNKENLQSHIAKRLSLQRKLVQYLLALCKTQFITKWTETYDLCAKLFLLILNIGNCCCEVYSLWYYSFIIIMILLLQISDQGIG